MFLGRAFHLNYSLLTWPQISSYIQRDPVPLPGPTTPFRNPPSAASVGAQHCSAEQRCKTSSGMKTSSIYRALRPDESFQRAFWKGSHLAAPKAYAGKQACYLASSLCPACQPLLHLCSRLYRAPGEHLMLYIDIYELLKKFSSRPYLNYKCKIRGLGQILQHEPTFSIDFYPRSVIQCYLKITERENCFSVHAVVFSQKTPSLGADIFKIKNKVPLTNALLSVAPQRYDSAFLVFISQMKY